MASTEPTKRNQINEPQSRALVRLMIFTCWLSFMASVWLMQFDKFFIWSTGFWMFMIAILAGTLLTKEK